MKLKLVENWRECWRWASVQLAALVAGVVGWIVADPTAVPLMLELLPDDLRALLAPFTSLIVFGFILVFRIFCVAPKSKDRGPCNDR